MKLKTVLLAGLAAALPLAQAGAATQDQTLHGKVVNYLSYLGSNNSGALADNPGGGGIQVNIHNASIHTHGNTLQVQPLGLVANGTLYLLVLPDNKGSVAGKVAGDVNQSVALSGEVIQKDGSSVLVVHSVK